MKKTLLLMFAFMSGTFLLHAQVGGRTLKKVMELKMPKTADDDMPGTRGASVAWHPLKKQYYASFAGNTEYPHAVFNATGKRLSGDDLTTQVDTRGLWYNTATKKISGNGYGSSGWFNYTLDPKTGIPAEYNIEFEGTHQPGDQCVGVFNPGKKEVLFLNGLDIFAYNTADAKEKEGVKITLHWGRTKTQGIEEKNEEEEVLNEGPEGYNNTSIVYTGIAGAEIGALNTNDKLVELYDYKTGFLTQKLKLPSDAVVETSFNFAFANGIYWLFNIEERKWIGYK
ncbi:MAG: hypothetical protein KTQ13_06175 [Ferruginibacter sp.]|nr:hypothetical protein [Chitinophagaceae bacterium]MBP6287557.1 hypothetical protein [Ferruginibacter sp.]MBU9936220.1 hypothetical protein [Ferruginibacter sp.]